MGRTTLFYFVISLGLLSLLFSSSKTSASPHATCPISRIAYIPASNNDAEPIFIDHSHLSNAPEKAKNQSSPFRLRGVHRNFSIACYSPASLKTAPVDAASLTAPPLYNSPDCVYPQHNYLFRLTPF